MGCVLVHIVDQIRADFRDIARTTRQTMEALIRDKTSSASKTDRALKDNELHDSLTLLSNATITGP